MGQRFTSIAEVMDHLQKKMEEIQSRSTNPENGTTSTSTTSNEYECPKCKDIGYIITGRNTARECECVVQRRINRLIKASQITEGFKKLTFKNFITKGKPQVIIDAYKCAANYCKRFPEIRNTRHNSICLLGQPGSGKTHLLIAASNYLLKRGIGVLYFPYREGFDEIKDDLDALEEKASRMKEVDVLFIDDLYKRGATEFEIKTMFSVINHRYLNHKPIMVSSEFLEDDLLDIDEALGSRILEMAKDFTVPITGDRKLLNHRLAR